MLYDAHTHLNSPELFKDYEIYIKEFIKVWGKKLVNVWVDEARTQRALQIQEKYPEMCYSSVWFHPSETIFNEEFKKDKEIYFKDVQNYIEKLIKEQKVVAIWECGLDYHYEVDEKIIKDQKELFILQCELAKKYNCPIIIHSRDAFDDSLEILKNYKDLKIDFHCWWYDEEQIKIIQNILPNLYIGFDGNITYKKADNLRRSLKATKIDRLLLETDAPYLTPQIVRKNINKPSYISYTYDYVCWLLWIGRKELEKQIEKNFKDIFWN